MLAFLLWFVRVVLPLGGGVVGVFVWISERVKTILNLGTDTKAEGAFVYWTSFLLSVLVTMESCWEIFSSVLLCYPS